MAFAGEAEPDRAVVSPHLPDWGAKPQDVVDIIVDARQLHQVMEGFGATHVSLYYQGKGDVIGAELRSQAIDIIYRQVGINTGNVEGSLLESPGGFDARRNDDADPLHYNWTGFDPFAALAAQEYLLAFSSPFSLAEAVLGQKINLRWQSPWLVPMREVNRTQYLDEAAEQVTAGLRYWRDEHGVVPRYEMLFNEPLSGNNEVRGGNVQELVDLVKRVGARMAAEGFGAVRLVIPNEERPGISMSSASAILADPAARRYVGAIGYHTYPYESVYASIPRILGTSGVGKPDPNELAARAGLRMLSEQYNIPVWMTKVSHGGVDPTSFEALRGRAIHIHDELVYANASAYYGMLNMWSTVSQEMHFGNRDLLNGGNEGNIVFVDTDTQKVYISGMGYAIGHYARWIGRGAVRIEATSGDPLILVTAFRDDKKGRAVLVLINNASAPRALRITVNGLKISGDLSGEQSTDRNPWQPLQPVQPVSPGKFEVKLPAYSVTTLAGSLLGVPATPTPTPTAVAPPLRAVRYASLPWHHNP